MTLLGRYIFYPKKFHLLTLAVGVHTLDLALISLAIRERAYIICDLFPHFGPKQVLSNSCFCSIASWVIQGNLIPINYMLL
jgi:hypothetical protein